MVTGTGYERLAEVSALVGRMRMKRIQTFSRIEVYSLDPCGTTPRSVAVTELSR